METNHEEPENVFLQNGEQYVSDYFQTANGHVLRSSTDPREWTAEQAMTIQESFQREVDLAIQPIEQQSIQHQVINDQLIDHAFSLQQTFTNWEKGTALIQEVEQDWKQLHTYANVNGEVLTTVDSEKIRMVTEEVRSPVGFLLGTQKIQELFSVENEEHLSLPQLVRVGAIKEDEAKMQENEDKKRTQEEISPRFSQETTPVGSALPVEETLQPSFDSHVPLQFSTQKHGNPARKLGYHLITEAELTKLNQYAPIVQQIAQFYKETVSDRQVHFVSIDKNDNYQVVPVTFNPGNFAHMTGIYLDNKESNPAYSAEQALSDFASGVGNHENILIADNNATFDKLAVLDALPNVFDARSLHLNDFSAVNTGKLTFNDAIRTEDKQLMLALKNIDGEVHVPYSLQNTSKARHDRKLSSVKQVNPILAVLSEDTTPFGVSMGTLSVNSDLLSAKEATELSGLMMQRIMERMDQERQPVLQEEQKQAIETALTDWTVDELTYARTELSVVQLEQLLSDPRYGGDTDFSVYEERDGATRQLTIDSLEKVESYLQEELDTEGLEVLDILQDTIEAVRMKKEEEEGLMKQETLFENLIDVMPDGDNTIIKGLDGFSTLAEDNTTEAIIVSEADGQGLKLAEQKIAAIQQLQFAYGYDSKHESKRSFLDQALKDCELTLVTKEDAIHWQKTEIEKYEQVQPRSTTLDRITDTYKQELAEIMAQDPTTVFLFDGSEFSTASTNPKEIVDAITNRAVFNDLFEEALFDFSDVTKDFGVYDDVTTLANQTNNDYIETGGEYVPVQTTEEMNAFLEREERQPLLEEVRPFVEEFARDAKITYDWTFDEIGHEYAEYQVNGHAFLLERAELDVEGHEKIQALTDQLMAGNLLLNEVYQEDTVQKLSSESQEYWQKQTGRLEEETLIDRQKTEQIQQWEELPRDIQNDLLVIYGENPFNFNLALRKHGLEDVHNVFTGSNSVVRDELISRYNSELVEKVQAFNAERTNWMKQYGDGDVMYIPESLWETADTLGKMDNYPKISDVSQEGTKVEYDLNGRIERAFEESQSYRSRKQEITDWLKKNYGKTTEELVTPTNPHGIQFLPFAMSTDAVKSWKTWLTTYFPEMTQVPREKILVQTDQGKETIDHAGNQNEQLDPAKENVIQSNEQDKDDNPTPEFKQPMSKAKKSEESTFDYDKPDPKELSTHALALIRNYSQSPEDMAEYLTFMSKFYDYSPRNVALIHDQWPGANAVATFDQWQAKGKELNLSKEDVQPSTRKVKDKKTGQEKDVTLENLSVRAGEKSKISLLRPNLVECFNEKDATGKSQRKYSWDWSKEERKAVRSGDISSYKVMEFRDNKPKFSSFKVFELSQTNLKNEAYPKAMPNIHESFNLDQVNVDKVMAGLKTYANEIKVPIQLDPANHLGNAHGAFYPMEQQILMNPRNTEGEMIATSIHELAHATLHNPKFIDQYKGEKVDYARGELEAEMTSFVVSKHFGLDTTDKAVEYMAHWSGNLEKLDEKQLSTSMGRVQQVAKKMIKTIEEKSHALERKITRTQDVAPQQQPIMQPKM